MVGELSLDGSVRHARGVLPMAAVARQQGFKRIFVPADGCRRSRPGARPGSDPGRPRWQPVRTSARRGARSPPSPTIDPEDIPPEVLTDFREVKGQEHVKRALEVAAAGGHNVMMIGPPGAGKTLLARAMPGILPRMSIEEALDVTRIYSVADQLPADVPLIRNRPFPLPAPHHQPCRAGGRRQLAASRRDLPGAPRRALPG